jgi:cardiolipin synthase
MIKKIMFFSGLAVVLFLLLFFWMDWDVKKGRAAYTKSHPLTITPIHSGDVTLYTKGNEFYNSLFYDIKNAKQYIYIHFFIARNDKISKKFFHALKQQAERGVDVNLSVDLLGGNGIAGDTLKDLKKHGVQFTYSRKSSLPFFFYSMHHRNHRRLVAIDGNISYIGGFNVGNEYLGRNKRFGKWQDYQLRISGNGAYEVQKQFIKDWEEDTGHKIKQKPQTASSGKTKHQYLYSSGAGMEEKIIQQINSASTSVILATPYFVPSKALTHALMDANTRGVKIKILVTKKTDAWFTQPPSYPTLEKLVKQGAEIYEFKDGFFHGKLIVIDEQLVNVGTLNWDQRSFFINDESNVVIYDKDVIKMITAKLEQDFQNSTKMTETAFHKLPFWARIFKKTPGRIQYYL